MTTTFVPNQETDYIPTNILLTGGAGTLIYYGNTFLLWATRMVTLATATREGDFSSTTGT